MQRTRHYTLGISTLLILVTAAGFRLDAQTIDQQNAAVNPSMGWSYVEEWVGTTFRPTQSTVAGAGIYLENWSGQPTSGLFTAYLYDDNANTGSLLAQGSGAFTTPSQYQQGAWFDVFWPAVSVTPGNQYTVIFHGTSSLPYSAVAMYNWDTSTGMLVYSPSGTPGSYGTYTGEDLNYREYATGPVTTTPEPASLALLATGLAGVVGTVRRKRRILTARHA